MTNALNSVMWGPMVLSAVQSDPLSTTRPPNGIGVPVISKTSGHVFICAAYTGGAFQWLDLTSVGASAGGFTSVSVTASQNLVSNTRYMMDNTSQVATVTLPAAPSIGDTIEILSNPNHLGFSLALSAGQTFSIPSASASNSPIITSDNISVLAGTTPALYVTYDSQASSWLLWGGTGAQCGTNTIGAWGPIPETSANNVIEAIGVGGNANQVFIPSVSNANQVLSVNATGDGWTLVTPVTIPIVNVTGSSVSAVSNTQYQCSYSGTTNVTFPLDADVAVGDTIMVVAYGGPVNILLNAGQTLALTQSATSANRPIYTPTITSTTTVATINAIEAVIFKKMYPVDSQTSGSFFVVQGNISIT